MKDLLLQEVQPRPRVGKTPGAGDGSPCQYACWEIPQTEEPSTLRQSTCGLKESDTTQRLNCNNINFTFYLFSTSFVLNGCFTVNWKIHINVLNSFYISRNTMFALGMEGRQPLRYYNRKYDYIQCKSIGQYK